ncbi:MAG: DUF4900 domain-containing protein [Melioribacteraceae bacterium]
MGGKGALLLVLGFSLIFMVAGRNFNQMATSTVENFANYYYTSKAHNYAAAGLNLVANKLFLNNSMGDNTFNYRLYDTPNDYGDVQVRLITIDPFRRLRQIVSTANYQGTTYTIKVLFQPSSFAKYAYFSDTEGSTIWWTTRDTVWGPFHTNGQLRVADEPVFYGKVTIDGSVVKYSNSARPKFYGGLETGVHQDIPQNGVAGVANAASAGGKVITGKNLVYMEFRGDSIRYRFSSTGSWTYVLASAFAPNGVIYIDNAEVHIKGTVKGQYTIAASGTGADRGKIYLDDNIVCYNNPQTNPNSTDMIGIVAERDVVVTDNTPNRSDIVIQAAIYAQRGSFTAENYNTRPPSGTIFLYGGITQYMRGPVGQFREERGGGITIVNGFSKRYRYDSRFMLGSPPAFPWTGNLEIVSWFE